MAALNTNSAAMTAASTYSWSTVCRMIAASSIHGIGAQNLASAIRHGRTEVSGIAFGPNFASAALASAPVRPRDTLLPPLTGADGAKTGGPEAADIVSLAFGSS